LLANEVLDALPNMLVTLDFDVGAHENAGIPRVLRAGNGVRGVIHVEIAEDLGAGGVGGHDFLLPANEALVLVKVRGVTHIFGDE